MFIPDPLNEPTDTNEPFLDVWDPPSLLTRSSIIDHIDSGSILSLDCPTINYLRPV